MAALPLSITMRVTPGASVSTPLSGYVSFVVDSRAAVNEPVVNGQATYATTSLGVGSHTVVASYLGTSLFATSQDTIASQVVNHTFMRRRTPGRIPPSRPPRPAALQGFVPAVSIHPGQSSNPATARSRGELETRPDRR